MRKYKYYFLVASILLIFMGAMVKLNGQPNYNASFIGGLINAAIFVYFIVTEKKQQPNKV